MRTLIVADDNGIGHVKVLDGYAGEAFWICGQKFQIQKDGRIKLGKMFMNRYGHTRSDGRKALIIETGAWTYQPHQVDAVMVRNLGAVKKDGEYLVLGAMLKRGPAFEPYYEYENGNRIPADLE